MNAGFCNLTPRSAAWLAAAVDSTPELRWCSTRNRISSRIGRECFRGRSSSLCLPSDVELWMSLLGQRSRCIHLVETCTDHEVRVNVRRDVKCSLHVTSKTPRWVQLCSICTTISSKSIFQSRTLCKVATSIRYIKRKSRSVACLLALLCRVVIEKKKGIEENNAKHPLRRCFVHSGIT